MAIDTWLTLLSYNQAKKKGLDSSQALKTTLLGQSLGGGNSGLSFVMSDRLAKREASNFRPSIVVQPTTEPASPVEPTPTSPCTQEDLCEAMEKAKKEANSKFTAVNTKLATINSNISKILKKIETPQKPPAGGLK